MRAIFKSLITVFCCLISLFTTQTAYENNRIFQNQTDLIIYSYDRPMQLYALLESIEKCITGLYDIFVIIRSSNTDYEDAYTIVAQNFPQVQFLKQSPSYNDLQSLTIDCFSKNQTPYLLFAVDDIIVKDTINLNESITALELSQAHGFYFRLGKNLDYCFPLQAYQPLPPLKHICADTYTWKFNESTGDWAYPNNLDFTLYRKSDVEAAIKNGHYTTPYSLESCFTSYSYLAHYGLCHEVSKVVNIPLNIVQNEYPNAHLNSFTTESLLTLFLNDCKIDISAFHQIANKSAHAALESLISFTLRPAIDEVLKKETIPEKLIVIVTPSYNNKDWWEWNLTSLLNQNYKNYYVIITDDCSTDGTGQAIENYIQTHKLHDKVKLIINKERRGALHNLYTMIHSCPDEAIIVTVDGDDALPDPKVLSRLNQIYSTQDVWLTYGQFMEHPSGIKGWCVPMPDDIVQNNAFREYEHLGSHLRTFYAWLFKSIKLYDLLDQKGDFYAMTWDYAIMLPMLEMAGGRHLCIEHTIMYLYNNANAISDHRISRQLQQHFAQVIRGKSRYPRLFTDQTQNFENYLQEKADLILFAEESDPQLVAQFLESLMQYVRGLGMIHVLYLPNQLTHNDYNYLKTKYPAIIFYEIDWNRKNFKDLLSTVYHDMLEHNYVIFARPYCIVSSPINLGECIKTLEETFAYSFSLMLSKENPHTPALARLALLEILPDICAWNFSLVNSIWACAANVNFSLYRCNEEGISYILRDKERTIWSFYDFQANWANEGHLDKIGLCFKTQKICKID